MRKRVTSSTNIGKESPETNTYQLKHRYGTIAGGVGNVAVDAIVQRPAPELSAVVLRTHTVCKLSRHCMTDRQEPVSGTGPAEMIDSNAWLCLVCRLLVRTVLVNRRGGPAEHRLHERKI